MKIRGSPVGNWEPPSDSLQPWVTADPWYENKRLTCWKLRATIWQPAALGNSGSIIWK
jgi:hypothetical protein